MKKLFIAASLALIMFSCKDDVVDNTGTQTNPLIGLWIAMIPDGQRTVVSHMQFTDKYFVYTLIFMDSGIETLRKLSYGKYTYSKNSSTIFFEIQEPASEAGVTSSSCRFYGDKLYCYGSKFFITERLHEKTDVSDVQY